MKGWNAYGNFTPAWIKKGFFNESIFCDDFLSTHQLLYVNGAFFTPEGRVTDTIMCSISSNPRATSA